MKREKFLKIKNTISLALVLTMILSLFNMAYAEKPSWDGFVENTETPDVLDLIDLNNQGDIATTGAYASQDYTKFGALNSLVWDHGSKKEILLTKDVPKDWSSYDYLEVYLYAENAQDSRFLLGPVCEAVAGVEGANANYFYTYVDVQNGWNHLTYNLNTLSTSRKAAFDIIKNLRFTIAGWNLPVNTATKYYIASVKLLRVDAFGSIKENYTIGTINSTETALQNALGVYAGSPNVLENAEVKRLNGKDNDLRSISVNNEIFTPVSFMKDYMKLDLDATNEKAKLSLGDISLSITVGMTEYTLNGEKKNFKNAPILKDNVLYVPAAEIAKAFGKYTLTLDDLLLIGNESEIKVFDTNDAINELEELAKYMAAYVHIDTKDISDGDYQKAIDTWRYFLVADENIDISDADFAKKLQSIETAGQAAWNTMNKGDDIAELFEGIKSVTSASLTSQYQRLLNMTLAYGTYGNKLYNNPSLKNDILFGLEWLYQNRYGPNEINYDGTGWRDPSEYNWWDWEIGVPEKLIDIMMIMNKDLSPQQKRDYLSLFHVLVPRTESTGANRIDLGKEIVGASLLQKDAQRLIEARDAIDQTFLYTDNGRNKKQGFYTDGTYIAHDAHSMNGTYGIEQLEETGVLLAVLKGTAFEYTNPQVDNVSNWYYDAYEPVIYQGGIMRMVRGRNNPPAEHTKGAEVLAYMIDMVDALDTDDANRFKSIIKSQVIEDTTRNYYTTLSVSRAAKLKDIMNDEAVLPRENYTVNKVYHNMDKVSHQRDDWAVGVSMSSSRIYPYECINGQNATGWYMGDGMVTVYNRDNFNQYSDNYWRNINPYRLPGITADTQERAAVNIATGNEWRSSQDFVGGVSLGAYGTAAMSLESYHSDVEIGEDRGSYGGPAPIHDSNLMAKKSWFMFDNELVALGSDIDASNNVNVLTIVDNKLSSATIQLNKPKYTGQKYAVESVTASQEPESENTAANTIDEDMGSKWAAEGVADITWDLGEVKTVGFINLAFINGNIRQHIFDLDISNDGITWTKVFSGMSSGTTEGIESFDLKNSSARYVKFTTTGSTSKGSQWISMATADIYPAYEGEIPVIEDPVYVGSDKIFASNIGEVSVATDDVNLTGNTWVNLENIGGYYFPHGGNLFVRRTNGSASFTELWFDHGVNPVDSSYEYVILPGKSVEETKNYSQNPDIEILSNTNKLQAVYNKKLDMYAIVFWEAGTFADVTVSAPMMVMYQKTSDGIEFAVSDPTHKLTKETISFTGQLVSGINKDISSSAFDKVITFASGTNNLSVDFEASRGRSICGKLIK